MKPPSQTRAQTQDSRAGLFYALTAYLLWGFLPLYMKALAHIPPVEVIAHRVLWSLPIALAVLFYRGRTADLRTAIRTPKMLGMGAVTAGLISVNWGIYVWAIGSGHAMEAALGYYINPLFSVFLGFVLLGERLAHLQWVAIGIAAVAVAILAVVGGTVPFVALGLTVTWAFYAYFKRALPIGPNQGFTLEVAILAPFALGFVVWLGVTGQGHFLKGVPADNALLIGCGLVTAVPLMVYANGAKGLRLSTIAMLQYVSPTLIFLTATLIFREPFGMERAITFALIWIALILFSIPLLRRKT